MPLRHSNSGDIIYTWLHFIKKHDTTCDRIYIDHDILFGKIEIVTRFIDESDNQKQVGKT